MAEQQLPAGLLFGMGNALLDIQVRVDKSLLDKYQLKENDAILSSELHLPMFDELTHMDDVKYIPGGATQNTIRVCQWMLKKHPNVTTYFGSVGDDHFAKTLAERTTAAGVTVRYQKHKGKKTGTCAVLITGTSRSLCADLAAAELFTIDHLEVPENLALIEKAKYFYIAGFFLTVCPPAIMRVAERAATNNYHFMMNLAAPFITQFYLSVLLDALPYIDILFGNDTEYSEFAKHAQLGTDDIEKIAEKVGKWMKKNEKRERIVVITRGDQSTIVYANGKLNMYPVMTLTADQLVDTNGAGDAFVGGFLSQLIQEKSIEKCIESGHSAAFQIIQQEGCTLPE